MRFLTSLAAALYVATALLPSPAAASPDEARAVAADELPRLTFLEPFAPEAITFIEDPTVGDAEGDLTHYAGKPVVLNFWATWCGPCRAEMPGLQKLADQREDVSVVTVAFGRHNPGAMQRFWDEAGITTLPLHLDAAGTLARSFGVRGLPHTVLLSADGQVLAEYRGEAEWDGEAVHAVLDALTQ